MTTRPRKTVLSVLITGLIAAVGAGYQYFYLEERGEYEEAIHRHYVAVFGKEPGETELRHLSTLALDRYGPTQFYRNEEDYARLFEKEAE